MNKDTVYFEMMDKMQSNCCPICELIKKSTLQSMDGFLYESVNDTIIRKEINNARGLCNYHSRLLLSMGDPLSHAIIYGDLLKSAIQDAKKDVYQQYDKHSNCRYCKIEEDAEIMYSTAFLDAYEEKEFQEKYNESAILCMSHLHTIQIISESKRKENVYNHIKNATIEKYKKLLTNLDEIKRKSDYRFISEKWTDTEKVAWKQAVDVINGLAIKNNK